MFVKNLSTSTLEVKMNGNVLRLQPGVNLVDSLVWKAEDLRKIYGPTVLIIIGEELPKEVKAVNAVEPKEEVPVEKPEDEGHDVLKDEGEEAGEADQAGNEPQPDNAPAEDKAEADKKEEGEAVKTETEDKTPAKATAKAKAPKATGKKNK